MAKLPRVTNKRFGSDIELDNIGQFGSAAAGEKINTKDIAEIQALEAWRQGWTKATMSRNKYPTVQERNGVDYVMSYQIDYMLKEGLPEYDSQTEYNKGAIIKRIEEKGVTLFESQIDENIGQDLDNTNAWRKLQLDKDVLRTNQITNCLLEVPQRIKYTLADGVLTIKAGSQVIVPYGVEDLTSQFPKGSTFLNDNFKVADTQYEDGKFFVWAELVNGFTHTSTTGNENIYNRVLSIKLTDGSFCTNVQSYSTNNPSYTVSVQYYDTEKNECWHTSQDGTPDYRVSLPVLRITSNTATAYAEVSDVFNGMGYIGSTYWIDKGVKGLIPNGRNTDGSLNNVEFTTPKLATATLTAYTNNNMPFGYHVSTNTAGWSDWLYVQEEKPSDNYSHWYKPSENVLYYAGATTGDYQPIKDLICGFLGRTNGIVTEWNPKETFHAVDYNDLQGKVSKTGEETISGTKTFTDAPLIIKSNSVDKTQAPSSNTGIQLCMRDKNNQLVGLLEQWNYTSGEKRMTMRALNSTSGTEKTGQIVVGVDADGNPYTSAPHSAVNGSIVTQAGLSKGANGYCKFGNGVIIQWGIFTPVSKNSGTVTLPTAFTGTNYSLCLTESGSAPTDDYANAITVKSWTKTNFTYQTGHAETPKYRYIAIGY